MFRSCRTLIALFAIALQAMDGIVGVMGHSHGDEPSGCVAKTHHHACGTCSHHRHEATKDQHENELLPNRPGRDSHDDCSLCRHVSQPVIAISVTALEVVSQQSEPILVALVERIAAADRPIHPARGPPALCS